MHISHLLLKIGTTPRFPLKNYPLHRSPPAPLPPWERAKKLGVGVFHYTPILMQFKKTVQAENLHSL